VSHHVKRLLVHRRPSTPLDSHQQRRLQSRVGNNRGVNFRALSSLFPLLLVALLAAACGGDSPSSSTPLPSAPFSQTDLVVGTGATAANGLRLTMFYTLWLYDPAGAESKGRQIQSNVGGTPFPFTLGVGGVIRGWDIGVVGMRVGGRRRLIIPPDLGYGASGSSDGSIPGGATLVFDIELVSVQ
jgi:FKBP-type peptidyl-prolyl cis-trans isomerase FkpA